MNQLRFRRSCVLLFGLALIWSTAAQAADPAATYLKQLSAAIELTRARIPTFTTSAQKAADRIVKGGKIYLTGRQRDFISEGSGRAGGLMGIHGINKKTTIAAGDVILAASTDQWTPEQIGQMQQWLDTGAQVVLFTNDVPSDVKGKVDAFTPAADPGVKVDGKLCPADANLNLVDLWVWTAEFVSACTRQGKMPILYQSVGVPGGRDRANKYKGQTFHTDLTIQPIPQGNLANAYLDSIAQSLKGVEQETDQLAQAAKWLTQAGPAKSCLAGLAHIFPVHFQDPRGPELFGTILKRNQPAPDSAAFVLHLSYQYPPDELLEQAKAGKFKLVYCSVQPGQIKADNILRIDPHWALADGAVTIKGYDVPVFPPSGVIQSAIYWSIAADTARQ